jgi:hypothetical protein
MSKSSRFFVVGACVTLVLLLSAVGYVGASVYRAGMVQVSVSGREGLSLAVPGILVPAAMSFVPDSALRDTALELEPYLPMVRAAIDELSRCEDGLFVHVVGRGEEVRVGKRNGALYVDVRSNDGNVHVSIPIHAVTPVLARLEAASRAVS